MQIVLFRHGIAEDREVFSAAGAPDSERPLTARGEERTRQAASGVLALLPELAAIGTSPYTRARQTADILASVYRKAGGHSKTHVVDDLQPAGSPFGICRWLEQYAPNDIVALVGHEPDLSGMMAWFTTGEAHDYARFKKAGAGLIEFAASPARGTGELLWLLPPAVLRRLAG